MSDAAAGSPGIPAARRRRLIGRGSFVAFVVVAALAYRYYWNSRPIGSGPAGPAVAREAFDAIWTDRPVLLVGLGDNVTAGSSASPAHGYFDRLAENPVDEFSELRDVSLAHVLPSLTVRNLAIADSNSIDCLEHIIPRLDRQDETTFGIVVITIGGNDIFHDYGKTSPREGAMYGATYLEAYAWIHNFSDRVRTMCDEITARFPGGCHIFFANICDPTDDVGDLFNAGLKPWHDGVDLIEAYNQVLDNVTKVKSNVTVIDAHQAFLGHGIHCRQFWRPHYRVDDPHYWYSAKLEDPNDRGYDALRRLFLNGIAKVVPSALKE